MTDVLTDTTRPTTDPEAGIALAERIVAAATASLELFSVHLGRRLGLYELLAQRARTDRELAAAAGISPRYAREWLQQQAVAGVVEATADADPDTRSYWLPASLRGPVLEQTDPLHVAPLADMVAGVAGVLDRLPAAYRTGAGIPYADYGASFRRGQGGINRPAFVHELSGWVEAVGGHLAGASAVRVADVGCGLGWSTIALAQALPHAFVDGYDSDEASVREARRHAREAGLGDRVSFHQVDVAGSTALAGPYDLALVFEALHDLARPVEALAEIRSALARDGRLLVADERVARAFTAPGDDVERLMWGWSVTHCLPAALAESPSAALGTALRPATVHDLAERAGFARSEELAIEHEFFRFYLLHPHA